MPELHIRRSGELLITTFGEYVSTVPWSDIDSWTSSYVKNNVEAYGRTLFEQITRDKELRAVLTRLDKNDRLVLVANQPEVAAVPWEYMRFSSDSQLSGMLLAIHYTLVRGVSQEKSRDRANVENPLTLIAVPVFPIDEPNTLNTEGEWRNLIRTIQERNRILTLKRVRPPILTAMSRMLETSA